MLIGSAIDRKYISLVSDNSSSEQGMSQIDLNSKVLTITGEIDGLMRISRIAEAHYHSYRNINRL